MKQMLDFNSSGLKKIHFLTDDLNFPVAIAIYSEEEEMKMSYLLKNIKLGDFSTETICKWCVGHRIQFQIVYPLKKISILKNPYKYYQFIRLKRKIHCYTKKNYIGEN